MKYVLFVSMDGAVPFGETYETEVEARVAAAEIRLQDQRLCEALLTVPATSIDCFLYAGDPQQRENLTFVREV